MPYTTGRMILARGTTTTWKICNSQKYAAGGTAWEIDINTAGTFTLLSTGTVDVDVYWGDGDVETVTTNSVAHVYPSAGTYTIGIVINSGEFRPYWPNSQSGDEIITLGDTPDGWSFGTLMNDAFNGSANLTTIGNIDTSAVTNFQNTWRACPALTSFPLIDTSNVVNFNSAWYASGVTSMPDLNFSSGSNFGNAWRNCGNLTSFPALSPSNRPTAATTFVTAWYSNVSLTDFPANIFDTTGALVSNAFSAAFRYCALSAQSIENILVSLDTNGATGVALNINDGTNAPKTTWSAAANTAYDNLIAKSWTITFTP